MSTEIPPARSGSDAAAAARLQILATEHWSLLATRALTYNEALSRVTIFLSILSGAVDCPRPRRAGRPLWADLHFNCDPDAIDRHVRWYHHRVAPDGAQPRRLPLGDRHEPP